jgi:hypothetical protein
MVRGPHHRLAPGDGEALAKAGGKYRLVAGSHLGVYLAPDATADAILAVEG